MLHATLNYLNDKHAIQQFRREVTEEDFTCSPREWLELSAAVGTLEDHL